MIIANNIIKQHFKLSRKYWAASDGNQAALSVKGKPVYTNTTEDKNENGETIKIIHSNPVPATSANIYKMLHARSRAKLVRAMRNLNLDSRKFNLFVVKQELTVK